MDSDVSDMEYEDSSMAVSKEVAVACVQRFTVGLCSLLPQDQSDALGVYEWLPVEWEMNYRTCQQWTPQFFKKKHNTVNRVVHILCTTKEANLQLKAVKCLHFLAFNHKFTDNFIQAGGLYVLLRILLHGDEAVCSESLQLMKQCVESGIYGNDKTLLVSSGLVDVLCCVFLRSQQKEAAEEIMNFLFRLFHRYQQCAQVLEVTKVCSALNQMLHQTEGTLGDPEVQAACLKKVCKFVIVPYWRSFVDSGLVLTLTKGLEKWKGSEVHEEAFTILSKMGEKEAATKVMVDAGILQAMINKEPAEMQHSVIHMIGHMLNTSVLIRDRCIKEGVVDLVLKFVEAVEPCGEMDRLVVWVLGSVFRPNPKGVPKEYAGCTLPVLQRALKSDHNHVIRMALVGLCGMTATYEGDEFENVDRLMECGLVPQIAGLLAHWDVLVGTVALSVVTNLGLSKKTPVLKALLDAGGLSSALELFNKSGSQKSINKLKVAKLVMSLTLAGFGMECVRVQTWCFGVLLRSLRFENSQKCQSQTQTYTQADLIDFGERIAQTGDLKQIRELLDRNRFAVYLFDQSGESDPLRDRKLSAMVKIVDSIRQMGLQQISCYYTYHLNEMLKNAKLEDTKTKLAYILECLCSRPEQEEGKISPTPSVSSSGDSDSSVESL